MNIEETVDRESQEKLYVQIFSIIKGKIEKGEWSTGNQIPTEDELCKSFDVSKATVRIAISELVRDGFLKRWQGKGTFVANPVPHIGMAMRTHLTEDMFGEGVRTRQEVIARGVGDPPEDVRPLLGGGGLVYRILRRRLVEEKPACVDEFYMPSALFPGIEGVGDEEICGSSFYDLIKKKSVRRVCKVVQNIEIGELAGEHAEMMGSSEGAPALLLHRLFIGPDERPIAYSRLFGKDRYRIQTEFERIR